MTQKNWMAWIWLVLALAFLWTPSVSTTNDPPYYPGLYPECTKPWKYLSEVNVFVADTFTSFVYNKTLGLKMLFLQRNSTFNPDCKKAWPQMGTKNGSYFLYVSGWHVKKRDHPLWVLHGENCPTDLSEFLKGASCTFSSNSTSSCQMRCLNKKSIECKKRNYDENFCSGQGENITDRFVIDVTATEGKCINCFTPVAKIDKEITLNTTDDSGETDPGTANQIIEDVTQLVSRTEGDTIAVSAGEGVSGVLVKTDPYDPDKVSFAYTRPTDDLQIIQDPTLLPDFLRSIEVSKEAFEKAIKSNISQPFAVVLRFLNMTKDEKNSTVLGNEVVAVEMGADIRNLTDTINVNFLNMKYEGTPNCSSWNGEGSRPNWTVEGCETLTKGNNITCKCTHLTFFAILLTPLNDTLISSYDLNTLTIITQAGCGMSMFFLGIVLFTHFLLRKTKATEGTRILINLVLAMFFLNFTFLTNHFVAKTKNAVGCKIMAALMHYFMLTTFTLFAAQAFHICLQLYTGGRIGINHYILKVSITSWVIPSIIGTVLLSTGKYGEQIIYTDNAEDNVAMCWITDVNIHYFVNIGYYALVFLFTFTTFVITLSWLYCLRRSKNGSVQTERNSIRIMTILGLCCMLGVTWGFAFFAYGVLRMPATYIFTALNSFQGFFLFVYYHCTSQSRDTDQYPVKGSTASSSTTLKTGLDIFDNPYSNLPAQNKMKSEMKSE